MTTAELLEFIEGREGTVGIVVACKFHEEVVRFNLLRAVTRIDEVVCAPHHLVIGDVRFRFISRTLHFASGTLDLALIYSWPEKWGQAYRDELLCRLGADAWDRNILTLEEE